MAPKKKEKNLKRSNIITLKLTDIELAVLNEAADVTGDSVIYHQKVQSFMTIFLIYCLDQHTFGIDSHHEGIHSNQMLLFYFFLTHSMLKV